MARRKTKSVEPVTRQAAADPGGQSGDLQGLSRSEESGNESVRELMEDGQFYEAALLDAVENAPPPDAGPLRPHRRQEDDLPPEYTDQPPDEPKE